MDKGFKFFLAAVAASSFGLGLGLAGGLASNFYHEAYGVDSFMRGALEFPREIPAILCVFAVMWIVRWGDVFAVSICQLFCAVAMATLGFWTPPLSLLFVVIAVNSFGIHTYFPLHDAIVMRLSEENGDAGTKMGRAWSISLAAEALAGVVVFFGFKFEIFTYTEHLKWVFLLSSASYLTSAFLFGRLRKVLGDKRRDEKMSIKPKKNYAKFYARACLIGMQKQMKFVFAPWLIITILAKSADFMAVLLAISLGITVFWAGKVGKLTDIIGTLPMLKYGGFGYVGVYVFQGFLALGFVRGFLPPSILWVSLTGVSFALNILILQTDVARLVDLNQNLEQESDLQGALSLGTSLDHLTATITALAGGWVWAQFGAWWVFFIAALISVLNIILAHKKSFIPEQQI